MGSVILREFVVSFLVATVLSAIFAWATRSKGRQIGLFWFFLIVLMATWSGGIWIQPLRATPSEIKWWPFIIIGLPFAILIAVFGPRNPPEGRHETLEKLDEIASEKVLEKLTYVILKVVFWFVVIFMAAAILWRYVM